MVGQAKAVCVVHPVIDFKVRSLCRLPYPGHPHGCPNWSRRENCPPACRTFEWLLDMKAPVFCVFNQFDLKSHVEKMSVAHPAWSITRLRCCLYWQAGARKQLRNRVQTFLRKHPGLVPVYCPEGAGVDVTCTMAQIGVELEWPPVNVAYQVALVGSPAKLSD